MNTPADTLRRVRARLSNPAHWIKEAFARDEFGFISSPAKGVCWCLEGAIQAEASNYTECSYAFGALDAVIPDGRPPSSYNDDPATTHADILALLDKAIEAADGT